MKLEDSVVAHFKSSVGRYTQDWLERNDFVVKAFEPYAKKSLKVLDIGCGTGHMLEALSVQYPHFDLHGIDITPAMIRKARAIRSPNIGLMLGDSLHLPFENRTFDAVVLYDVLHHLIIGQKRESDTMREMCLREALRIIKHGGFIVLQEVGVHKMWRAKLIFFVSHTFSRLYPAIPAVNFFDFEELNATFALHKLSVADKEIKPYKSLVAWISTLGSYTIHASYVLAKGD